jgi:hypothetical protein
MDYLPTSICYLEYLCDCLTNLIYKVSKQWIGFATTHWLTEVVPKLYFQYSLPLGVCRTLNFCGFKWSSFVAVYAYYFDTLVYWVNLKDLHGHAAEYTLISRNVSSEGTFLLLRL